MERFNIKYSNAIVRMHGDYNKDSVAKAATAFAKKAYAYKRSEEHDNKHSSRSIEKQ